jgi:DNA-binding IclR family transcriptional regulator
MIQYGEVHFSMLNNEPAGARRYQDEVPAVARAVRLLERLAASGQARALADLARELGVGPSSLLAILTTLRHAGLVARDQAGHYEVGPGLAALGQAAACKLRACERFAALADALVAALGETVLLWVRHEDGFVLAAAREGTQPLRYVPTPGYRLPANQTALGALSAETVMVDVEASPLIEEELLPSVWTIAVALPTGPDEQACIALAGPRDRLASPEARATLLAVASGAFESVEAAEIEGGSTPAPGGLAARGGTATASRGLGGRAVSSASGPTSGPIDGAELDAFLGQSLVATLSYLTDDGYPATVPLWYAWDGASFWLASRPGSEWAEHVKLDPRVSLAVSESTPPLRRVLARGLLAEVDEPGGTRWVEIETHLAGRYAGFDAAREPATAGRGRLFELKPERLIAWRGLLRHPKLPSGPETPGSTSSTSPSSTSWRHLG